MQKKLFFIFFLAFLLGGCASVTQKEIESANFGQKPINYQQDIRNLMSRILKDPGSATYEFGEPRKGMTQDGWAVGGKKHFGYIVPALINAKNSFGGYTGAKRYYFLFSEGQVMEITSMMNAGMGKILE